jgi:hypothetical protein
MIRLLLATFLLLAAPAPAIAEETTPTESQCRIGIDVDAYLDMVDLVIPAATHAVMDEHVTGLFLAAFNAIEPPTTFRADVIHVFRSGGSVLVAFAVGDRVCEDWPLFRWDFDEIMDRAMRAGA